MSPEAQARITRTRPKKYPAQISALVTAPMKAAIREAADESGETDGEIVRVALDAYFTDAARRRG